MKIEKMTIQNYRCFDRKEIVFAPHFNVFIGNNGTGKTALLDALSIGIGSLFLGIEGHPSSGIARDDVPCKQYSGDVPVQESRFPVDIEIEGEVAEERVLWRRSLGGFERRTTRADASHLSQIASTLQQQVRTGSPVILPLLAYFRAGRLYAKDQNDRVLGEKHVHRTVPPASRLRGYQDCLNATMNKQFLSRWLKTMELSVLQRGEPNPTLEAIKSAAGQCMEDWTRIYYDLQNDELVAEDRNKGRLPIRLLSDGQRNMLYMTLDIAYRSAHLNPHLGADAVTKTPGVVLIDEIDLHLHPQWQRRVVEDLRNTFPSVQFIATTHSPLIIQSLREGELRDLNSRQGEYVGQSPEDILEEVMGVELPQRSKRSQERIKVAEEYYALLKNGEGATTEKRASIKRMLDELMEPYADNEAYVAYLKLERAASGLDKEPA